MWFLPSNQKTYCSSTLWFYTILSLLLLLYILSLLSTIKQRTFQIQQDLTCEGSIGNLRKLWAMQGLYWAHSPWWSHYGGEERWGMRSMKKWPTCICKNIYIYQKAKGSISHCFLPPFSEKCKLINYQSHWKAQDKFHSSYILLFLL